MRLDPVERLVAQSGSTTAQRDLRIPVPRLDPPSVPAARVHTDGKHLQRAGRPFRVKGVTYGSFRPRGDGKPFPEPTRICEDVSAMAALGLNTVRTYALPPPELLDVAADLGMQVLVGLHYDDWRMEHGTGRAVHRRVLDAGRRAVDGALQLLSGRRNVLALSIGNEIPADLVRLHGIRPVEETLSALADHAHAGDRELLVTYSNYPTTEYLHVDGLDLVSFNVFLEDPTKLRAYLRHLQVVAGDAPLVVTELGLASEVHGAQAQAESIEWQLRVVDEVGCAGATVFAWTDEWGVAGEEVTGWGFGITTSHRAPKPAVKIVRDWAARGIRDLRDEWPTLSVVVCAYNEERVIDECLASLAALDYPNLDIVLCDDGSTDATQTVMQRYPFRVLDLPHGGLGAARNAGIHAADGAIVAFLDADAHCHPEWPYHLVLSLEDPGVVATGGPNLAVSEVGFVERAVAKSPGNPVEVLLTDDRAEHVPGCNMAYVKSRLQAIGGFDVVYTSAGDDVDVCWKLLDRGGQIAFSPAAQVRHHRRSTVKAYLKQQRGYGRSERMMSARHSHRFNRLGQARWSGSIYGGLRKLPSVLRPVIYHGSLGSAPYQAVTHRTADWFFGWLAALLPLTVPAAGVGALLALWSAWWLVLPALLLALILSYGGVVAAAAHPEPGEPRKWRWRGLIAFLHVAQPFARTWGRLRGPRLDEEQQSPASWTGDRLMWLLELHRDLARRGSHVRYGAPGSQWDLVASIGPLLDARITTAVHWSWTPTARLTFVPRVPLIVVAAVLATAVVAGLPAWPVAASVIVLVVEYLVLRARVGNAVRATTREAFVVGEGDGQAA